jgi:hypothetical protein
MLSTTVTHYTAANMTMTVWEQYPLCKIAHGVIRTNVTDFSGTYAVKRLRSGLQAGRQRLRRLAVSTKYMSTARPPRLLPALLTDYALSDVSTTVGGKEYPDAAKFDKGYQGVHNTTYDVYVPTATAM